MYNNEEYISEQDKQKMIDEYEQTSAKQLLTGKIIVCVIAVSSFIFSTISNILFDFNVFDILISYAMAIALFCGVRWIRWLYVASAFISCLTFFSVLASSSTDIPALGWFIITLGTAYDLVCGVLLAFNKSVSEFLYHQQTK